MFRSDSAGFQVCIPGSDPAEPHLLFLTSPEVVGADAAKTDSMPSKICRIASCTGTAAASRRLMRPQVPGSRDARYLPSGERAPDRRSAAKYSRSPLIVTANHRNPASQRCSWIWRRILAILVIACIEYFHRRCRKSPLRTPALGSRRRHPKRQACSATRSASA